MPSIGFRLFADTTAFERGLASAEGSTKSFRGVVGNLGGFIKGTFVATAVIALGTAIKSAVNHAQEMRDESLKTGQAIDLNTAAMARFGDAILGAKAGVKGLTEALITNLLGGLNRIGEAQGRALITNLDALGITKGAVGRMRYNEGVDQNVAVLEAGMAAAKKLGEFRKKAAFDAAADDKKINLLLVDNFRLSELQHGLGRETAAWKEKQLAIEENNAKLHEVDLAIQKRTAEEGKNLTDQIEKQIDLLDKKHRADDARAAKKKTAEDAVATGEGDLATAQADRGKMTLGELAEVSPFAFNVPAEVTAQSSSAKESRRLLEQGEAARKAGRADEANDYFSQSDQMKSGLTALKSSERADPFQAYKAALKESEDQLRILNDKFAAIEP
jgi:hypothetical protein